jgi:hypothetical protein
MGQGDSRCVPNRSEQGPSPIEANKDRPQSIHRSENMNYHKLFVAVSLGLALTGVMAQPALAKKAPSVPAWEEAQLNADKNSSVKSKANVPTSSSVNDKDVIWQTSVDDENNKGDSSLLKKIRERMKDKDKKAQVAKKRKAEPDFKSLPESVAKYKPQYLLPDEYQSLTIFGKPLATEEQAVALLNILNPKPKLTCSVKDIVHYYWKEAGKEGIRPDVAFAQAILETGTFRYGGDVLPTQNNFCGLGTVGGGVKGATFKDAEMGVRAHIQHLLAYTDKKPSTKIIDPRYELAHKVRARDGFCTTWYQLNGNWAKGGYYAEKIMTVWERMMNYKAMAGVPVQSDVLAYGRKAD